MGWPHTVLEFVKHPDDGCYYYREVYAGKSGIRALIAFIKAKRNGSGCIKWEWR